MATAPDLTAESRWSARLDLAFERRGRSTVLTEARHCGPLRIQRPFTPEGPEHPHLCLLHPPGGLVPGDELDIDLRLGPGSSALLTTPASGKVYGVGGRRLPQRQSVTARIADGALLEWLPQDTILFDGADVTLENRFELGATGQLCCWELVSLGRPAGDRPFTQGSLTQRLEIWRNRKPLLLERFAATGGDAVLQAPWGLGGETSFGLLVATVTVDPALRGQLVELGTPLGPTSWSVTSLPEITVIRYRGSAPRAAFATLAAAWALLRPTLSGRPAVPPRIWAT